MPAATALAARLATTLSLAMVVMTVRMGILRCDFAQCERSEEMKMPSVSERAWILVF
jgi:hypothetical protein